jgi:putative FmdB family regulatory protein
VILYDFICERCGIMEEIYVEPEKISDTEQLCPTCQKKLRRKYSSPTIKVAFRAGHDPYTGMDFDSQRKREQYMAENGIIKGE